MISMDGHRLGCAMAMLLLAVGGKSMAQQGESSQPTKPFLLVEGEFDRNHVSDLYTFEMNGKLIKRLTSEPLPGNYLAAVAPGLGDPYFSSSALFGISLRQNILMAVNVGDVRLPALSPDGKTIAFVTTPEAPPGSDNGANRRGTGEYSGPPLFLRVQTGINSSPRSSMHFPLPAGVVPSEMTFTPDGQHVLITHWAGDLTAQLLLVDLKNGATRTALAADGLPYSYYAPAFAPDGKSLLVVRENFSAGLWDIVSFAWPDAKTPTVIVTAPRGVSLSTPMFLADGKRFLFFQEDTLARATLDGKTIDPLFGDLIQEARGWVPAVVDRRRPVRAGWIPQVVARYFAHVEWRPRGTPTADPAADLVVIDVQTGQRTTVPMPSGRVRKAVVVE